MKGTLGSDAVKRGAISTMSLFVIWAGTATVAAADANRTLHYAVRDNDLAAAKAALAQGADPNKMSTGRPLLHWACAANYGGDRRALAETLLQAGADPNGRDSAGVTALHFSGGRIDCVEPLLAAGADPKARTFEDACAFDGRPVLEQVLAVTDGRTGTEGIQALVKAGADPSQRGCNGASMHWVAANRFLMEASEHLQREKAPPAGWWKRHVEIWRALDWASMADADAQKLMAQAVAIAIALEQEAK